MPAVSPAGITLPTAAISSISSLAIRRTSRGVNVSQLNFVGRLLQLVAGKDLPLGRHDAGGQKPFLHLPIGPQQSTRRSCGAGKADPTTDKSGPTSPPLSRHFVTGRAVGQFRQKDLPAANCVALAGGRGGEPLDKLRAVLELAVGNAQRSIENRDQSRFVVAGGRQRPVGEFRLIGSERHFCQQLRPAGLLHSAD